MRIKDSSGRFTKHTPKQRQQSAINRFNAMVDKTSDCWNWTGVCDTRYYGLFYYGTRVFAHRFSYEVHKGKIGEKLVIDHLCRNHSCVNPSHLEAVTQSENIRRGNRHKKEVVNA